MTEENLTESDTRAKLITPALHSRGWREDMIRREETAGAIELVGDVARRSPDKRADYVLRIKAGGESPLAIALIEAKRNTQMPEEGMQQAKNYARRMHVPFVFSSNGYRFVEFDATTETTTEARAMEHFPTPDDLRRRYEQMRGLDLAADYAKPLLTPYAGGEGARRYYQDAAIRAALEKMALAKKTKKPARVLLSLATGAGKTFIAVHLLKRIFDAGGKRKMALFLCDRDALRQQAFDAFHAVFGNDAEIARATADGGNVAQNARIHIATYQTLGIDSESDAAGESFARRHYPRDFFTHIVIDECHRSAWDKWSAILRDNPDAAQIGLTATPRRLKGEDDEDREITAHNIKHFGEPVYSYALTQGAEDGYLALCKIEKSNVDIDNTGVTIDEVMARAPIDHRTGEKLTREQLSEIYEKKNYEKMILLPDRIEAMCADLFGKLAAGGDPLQKTIVFCVRRVHADMVVAQLNHLFAEWRLETGAPPARDFAFRCMAEDGDDELREFRAEDDRRFVAVTVDLLTTGVDIPRVRNIVFFRYVRSPIQLHQMIGRGARIDEANGKLSFSVFDYTNATDLLGMEDWQTRRATASDSGKTRPIAPPVLPIVDGFKVNVADTGSYVVVQGENGAPLRLSREEYRKRLVEILLARAGSLAALRREWTDAPERAALLDFLRAGQCSPKTLGALQQMEDFDEYDILADAAFGALPRTRADRAQAFDYKNKDWLEAKPPATAAVLRELARHFAQGGIEELENERVFETPAIRKAGGVSALEQGGKPVELLRQTKERILSE